MRLDLLVATAGRELVLALPVDLVSWDEDTRELATRLSDAAQRRQLAGVRLLLVGTATPRAAGGFAQRGITVEENYLRR